MKSRTRSFARTRYCVSKKRLVSVWFPLTSSTSTSSSYRVLGSRNWLGMLSDVTLALPEKERSRFVAAGVDPEALEGRLVRVRGIVRLRDGPRIDITEPAAIEILPEDVAGAEVR